MWKQAFMCVKVILLSVFAAFFSSSSIAQVSVHTQENTRIMTKPSVLTIYQLQADWADILQSYTHVDNDGLVRVDYAALSHSKTDMQRLGDYIMAQSLENPSQLSRTEAMAYWANLYNALTLQVVAQNYPVNSIREIKSGRRKGPWKRKLVIVEGQSLSLDNIEHDILRPRFKTPLVHYMVNCASIGCPNLRQQPWQAQTLEVDLETAARAYINSPRGVRIENGKIHVSKIYKWFKADFGSSKTNVLKHLKQYAAPELRTHLDARAKIDHYGYDWSLNNFHDKTP